MNTTEHTKLKLVLLNRLMGMAAVEQRYQEAVSAFRFAESVHLGVRKDGVTPEFYHQLSILGRAISLHATLSDPLSVYVAILLHDCPEDYPNTIEDILRKFPAHASNSMALSKYDYLDRPGTTPEMVAKEFSDYIQVLSASPVLSVVKLLDRLHNLSTMLGVFSAEKVQRYINEVDTYFLPMLKEAKHRFPEQEAVYEIIKSDLNTLVLTIRHFAPAPA